MVPVAPGGGSDFIGRVVTERWGQLLKTTIIVDNQGGGGGIIASQYTARANPGRLYADARLRGHARYQPGDPPPAV